MKKRKVVLDFGKKKIKIEAKRVGVFSYGLMFRTKNTKNLVFEFNREVNLKITGLFVFFSFIAVWLDKEGKVIEARKIRPFTFSALPRKPFATLVEIPLNLRNKKIVDDIEKFKYKKR